MQASSSESGRGCKKDVIVTKYPSLPALALTEFTVTSEHTPTAISTSYATFLSLPSYIPSTLKHYQRTLQTFKMYLAFPHECLGNCSYVKRPKFCIHPSSRSLLGRVLVRHKGRTVKGAWTRAGLSQVLLPPSRRRALLFLS